MDYKKSLILVFTILILSQICALDCQYQNKVFDHKETIIVPVEEGTNDEIELITFSLSGTEKAPLYFFNENDFNVDIEYDLSYRCNGYDKSDHYSRTLIPGTNEIGFGCGSGYYRSVSNIAYRDNNFVDLENQQKSIYVDECMKCGDKNCFNDGVFCSINFECGSKNCIRNICSNTKDTDTNSIVCYNKDCNCSSDEIQFNNLICIKKQSMAIGGAPITGNPGECITNYVNPSGNCAIPLGGQCVSDFDCGNNYCVVNNCSNNRTTCYNNDCNCEDYEIQFDNNQCIRKYTVINGNKPLTGKSEECISKFINSDTGLCSKDPDTADNEKLIRIKQIKDIIFFILVFVILGCIPIFIFKYSKFSKYKQKFEEMVKLGFPFKNKTKENNYHIWINDKEYPCFYRNSQKTNDLVHKYVAKELIYEKYISYFNKKYPNQKFDNLHVHHIDKNTINYNLKNLILISEEEHRLIKHSHIKPDNRISGLKELIFQGISNPHLKKDITYILLSLFYKKK